jgi:hypothetical protein
MHEKSQPSYKDSLQEILSQAVQAYRDKVWLRGMVEFDQAVKDMDAAVAFISNGRLGVGLVPFKTGDKQDELYKWYTLAVVGIDRKTVVAKLVAFGVLRSGNYPLMVFDGANYNGIGDKTGLEQYLASFVGNVGSPLVKQIGELP